MSNRVYGIQSSRLSRGRDVKSTRKTFTDLMNLSLSLEPAMQRRSASISSGSGDGGAHQKFASERDPRRR
jgi:hypothetical protein